MRNADHAESSHIESRGIELALGLALPAAAGLISLAEPIVRVLFQRGAFAATDTAATGSGIEGTWTVDTDTGEFDFEGYRIYRSTDPDFRDARIITNGNGTNTIGNGRPIAQYDLVDGRKGLTRKAVEGVAYQLGTDSGLEHTFVDSTVTNGQDYYYAVCAYDYGFDQGAELDSLSFYPSENSYSISFSLRGGSIFPSNVVKVRPNPRVPGFTRALAGEPQRLRGRGTHQQRGAREHRKLQFH